MNFESLYVDVQSGDELRLSAYLPVISQHWRMILAVTLSTVPFVQTPVYRADAMIQLEDPADEGNGNVNRNKDPLQTMASIFDTSSGQVTVLDLMGNPSSLPYSNDVTALTLSEAPIYVISTNAGAAKANVTTPVGYGRAMTLS